MHTSAWHRVITINGSCFGLLIISVHAWETVTFKTSKVSSTNYSSHIKKLSLFSTLLKLHFIAFCRGNYINLSTIDYLVQITLCWGVGVGRDSSVHYRM